MEARDAAVRTNKIPDEALDQLFREARTHTAWLPRAVPLELLKEIYDLARMGPTSANCSPARFVFLTTAKAKNRLLPALAPETWRRRARLRLPRSSLGTRNSTRTCRGCFRRKYALLLCGKSSAHRGDWGFRNGSLQGGYFILAARALGLDCGPMSGFDAAKVNAEFFPDGKWKANFLCNLGYGDDSKLFPRNPRLEFR